MSNAGKYDTGLCIAYLQEDIRIQNRYKDALQHVMATDVGWQMFLFCFSCSTGRVTCINCLPLAFETQGTTAAGDRTDGNRSSAQSGGWFEGWVTGMGGTWCKEWYAERFGCFLSDDFIQPSGIQQQSWTVGIIWVVHGSENSSYMVISKCTGTDLLLLIAFWYMLHLIRIKSYRILQTYMAVLMVIVYHTDLRHNLPLGESRQLGSYRFNRGMLQDPTGTTRTSRRCWNTWS